MKLVGLVGLRRSGKDTAAQVLVEEFNYECVKFAGALKEMLATYLEYVGGNHVDIEEMIEGSRKEIATPLLQGRTPRHAMQTLGTEWGRNLIGENLWVQSCLDHCAQFDKAAISDVRFPNEARAIADIGGTIVRIVRPGLTIDSHPSESLIADLPYHYSVTNDGTIEQFQQRVRELASVVL